MNDIGNVNVNVNENETKDRLYIKDIIYHDSYLPASWQLFLLANGWLNDAKNGEIVGYNGRIGLKIANTNGDGNINNINIKSKYDPRVQMQSSASWNDENMTVVCCCV